MSKYLIHVENIGDGADWDGTEIECNGFVIMADQSSTTGHITQHDISTMTEAILIASNDSLRVAARLGLALSEAYQEKSPSDFSRAAEIRLLHNDEEDD